MPVWTVSMEGKNVAFGDVKRRRIMPGGCNEPFKGRYWCPKLGWFRQAPCPFVNKHECEAWQRMCGNL